MIAEILIPAGTFLAGGGAAWLGNYVAGSWGKNPDPVAPKPPAEKNLVDLIKEGYEACGKLADDIHRLYHPEGCRCAMCLIKADDKDEPPSDDTTVYCDNPCFNCSVLTCDTHPDRRPQRKMQQTSLGIPVPPEPRSAVKRVKAVSQDVPSSTLGHHHLIIANDLPWQMYTNLFDVLATCGIIQAGYAKASVRKGFAALRPPWVHKTLEQRLQTHA